MEKATARPWEYSVSGVEEYGHKKGHAVICGPKEHSWRCGEYTLAVGRISKPENAALIVRAVNSHEALIEACEAALLEQVDDMGRKSETHLKLEAALKLAKGA